MVGFGLASLEARVVPVAFLIVKALGLGLEVRMFRQKVLLS